MTSPDVSLSDEDGATEPRITDIVQNTRAALTREGATVRDVITALGRAGFTPLLLLPALIVVTPASGIPGLSSVCGIIIALVAGQKLFGRKSIWLPDWILRRKAPAKVDIGLEKALPVTRWLDKVTKQRLTFLVSPVGLPFLRLICVLSGAVMPALELVPFTSSMLGLTVTLLAVAMVTRDGLVALVALGWVAAAATTAYIILPF